MTPLDNRVPPPVAMLAVAAAMGLASRWLPAVALGEPLRCGLAAASAALALTFALPAFRAFAVARTTINPIDIEAASSLVTGGIYRFTRNPMYVGLTLLLVALAAGLASPWTLLGPLLFALFITRFQIIPEERIMAAKFGDAYAAYRQRVRRWL